MWKCPRRWVTFRIDCRGHISRFQPKPGRGVDRLLPHDARVHQLVQQQRPQVAHQGDPGVGTRDRPIWQA